MSAVPPSIRGRPTPRIKSLVSKWWGFLYFMHFVYIIYTPAFDKYYVGESIDPFERLFQHNNGFYKGSSTSYTKDWELKLILPVVGKEDAVKIERHIKSMKSKTFILNLISDEVFLQEFKRIAKEKFRIEFL